MKHYVFIMVIYRHIFGLRMLKNYFIELLLILKGDIHTKLH